jgi:TPR repeat protein
VNKTPLPVVLLLVAVAAVAGEGGADVLELQRRAAAGDAAAMTGLGAVFFDGKYVAKDEVQSAEWFRRAAEKGFAPAQARYGWMVWKGRGVAADGAEAELWLRKAVAQGEAAGQETLVDVVAADRDRDAVLDHRALEARFRAAAERRSLRSSLSRPSVEERLKDFKGGPEEVKWFLKAADKGGAAALRKSGLLAVTGTVVVKNEAEGARRLKEAAEKGDVEAQGAYGLLLMLGRGVEANALSSVSWLTKAAGAGDILSSRALGWIYETGRGVPADEKAAAKWYRRAADGGDAWARTALGRMTEDGRGVAKKPEDAAALYKAAGDFAPALVDLGLLHEAAEKFLDAHTAFGKAAELGDAVGRYHLGVLFEIGRGGRRDPSEAARQYDVAAFAGVADAQARWARLFELGLGVKKDEARAAALYAEADGSPLAALALGLMRWEGRGGWKDASAAVKTWRPLAEKKDPLAAYWCARASDKSGDGSVGFYRTAAQGGEVRAQARLGILLKESAPEESVQWLTKAAEGGDAASAAALARRAKGTPDESAALLRAARLGDRACQMAYARLLLSAEGSAQDSAGAVRWFRMAAAQNDMAAQHQLASLLLAGEGAAINPVEAARWLTVAAGKGYAPAQRDLAMLYENGLGVKKDRARATEWYKKAAAAGDAFSKTKLSK